MGRYSNEFKRSMIEKLLTPEGPSAMALSESSGVSTTTLSRWLQEAASVALVVKDNDRKRAPRPARRPEDWPAEERLRVLSETAALEEPELGAYLRRGGLHGATVEAWRAQTLAALGGRRERTREQKRLRELERELLRKDKALAETAALLVLAKKARALWGDEDDDTTGKSGR